LDQKVDFNGKTLEVGNSMVEKLKDNKKVNWQFVDKDTADKELREGDYYMVVTIPQNFSKNATSLSNDNPEKMNIDFTTNFTKSKNGEKIMETVASNLTNTVKDQVVKTYTATLYSKFSEIGSSLQKAADASNQLNNGLGRLSEGGQKLGSGINQLADGSGRLASGLGRLSEGGAKLSGGIDQLTDGSGRLSAGLNRLSEGGAKLGNGVSQLQEGAGKLSSGLSTLNDKKAALVSGVNELTAGSNQLTIGFDTFKTKSVMLTDGIDKLHKGSEAFKEGLLKYTNGVLTLNEKLLAKKGDLEKLSAGSATLNNGIDRLSDGISQINSKLASKKDDLNRLAAGGTELENGVAKLSESTPKLVDGADKINTGLNALNSNLPSDSDLAAKKSNLTSTLDKLKGLKITYRTNFNPLSSAFTDLGAQIESLKEIVSRIDTQSTTTTTTTTTPAAPTPAPTTNFSGLEQTLASMKLTPEQKAQILAAAKSDAAATPAAPAPQPTTTVQNSSNNNNSQIKAELTSAINSAASKYSSMKYRVGKLNYIQTQLDKFDVNSLATDLEGSINGLSSIKSAVGQLAAGSGQLKAGLTVMNEKTPTLIAGFNQYKGGVDATVSSLTSGELVNGLNQLANATPKLKEGVSSYTNGVNSLTTSMTTGELAQGVGTLASKGTELQAGFNQLSGGIQLIHEKLPELAGGIDALVNGNARINAGLNKRQAKLPEPSIGIQELDNGGKKLYQGLTDMKAKAPELLSGLNSAKDGADKLHNGLSAIQAKAPELLSGLNNAKDGSEKLSNGLSAMKAKAPELINGVNSAKEGADKLHNGLSSMQAKAPELINGVNSAKEGADKLHNGLSSMQAKAPELINGVNSARDGALKLSGALTIMQAKAPELLSGLEKAKDGSGLLADKLSSGADKLSAAKTGDKNVDMMSNPIKTNISDISEETSYGNAMAPFFLVFGLLIAAAAFNILFPARKAEYGESTNSLFGTRLVAMTTFAILATIIEVVAMSLFFDFKVQNFGMYFFGLILSGIVFMLITHFLSYTFGKVGNAISIGFVALQFVLTTPLFPKEMLPSLYSGLIPFTPVFYGDTAVRQAVLGGLTNEIYNSAILILVVLGIIFLTLTYISYNKNNKTAVNLAK
ncbi:MAG: YhgE/Pip domain-containing protein, partial [Gemella haemolysans]|nr:YhgE/Pip domain-containing protein [Gemella haemolysans]